MMNKKRVFALMLTFVVSLNILPCSLQATEQNTPKEEVVYINLDNDGSVSEINVVNIFQTDDSGKIVDYGEYESVRNMTSTDEICYADNVITIETDNDKLYYEGKLSENNIPWDIKLHYYMDGREYSAEEIAGKSGLLELTLTIEKSGNCDETLYNNFLLQAALTLDTDICHDIEAEGATIANVGSDKQITYTIIPGMEADYTITAKVENFEMESIAINGLPLNLDLDVDEDINNVPDNIIATVGEFNSAISALTSGAKDLYNGLYALSSQNETLTNAAWSAFDGLCQAASTQLNTELTANGFEPVTLTPSNYSSTLTALLAQFDADDVYNQAYSTALAEVSAQVEANSASIYSGYIESQANSLYLTYLKSQEDILYYQAVTEAIYNQFISAGYTAEYFNAYIASQDGQTAILNSVAALSDEDKSNIINVAMGMLTEEEKSAILQGALNALTEEQKNQIKDGYIQQMMASEEVTSQITNAVSKVSQSAANIAALKGQLDNYNAFYQGLLDYTAGVSQATIGANTLQTNMDSLCSNTSTLSDSIGSICDEANTVLDDYSFLFDKDTEIVSFVSEKNTNVTSVQFVIKTEGIKLHTTDVSESADTETENLSLSERFFKLFEF